MVEPVGTERRRMLGVSDPIWEREGFGYVGLPEAANAGTVGLYKINWKKLALSDRLTGVGNRLALEFAFEAERREALVSGDALLLVQGDGDGLRSLNNSFGHDAGDAFIKAAADRLATLYAGCVYRWGGDEFTVMFRVKDRNSARSHVRRLRRAFPTPVRISSELVAIGMSFGYVVVEPKVTLSEAVKAADVAMYRVKSRRRRGPQQMSEGIGHQTLARVRESKGQVELNTLFG